MKKKIATKILSKSSQFNYYKKQTKKLKKKNKNLNKKLNFIDFEAFLAHSYVSPVIKAPFNNEDKRVFAFMDHLSKYLIKNVRKIENKPLVSVIMPAYNRKDIIKMAIDSVLNQTYENFELIIIDDCSTDGTRDLLKNINDSRIKLIFHDTNKGSSGARNSGLKEAKGEYITYLDSDNEWDSRYIETVVGAFLELPNADALYSGQLLYKTFDSKPYAMRFGAYNKSLLHNHNYIDMNCFAHKSYIYKKIGGFDESLWRLVDWDFILKISNNFKIYSIPVILSKYYNHDEEDRITNIPFDFKEYSRKIIEKNKIPTRKYDKLKRKVSIIIPSYESLKEINNCINSILSFNYGDMVKIIIVDNASSGEVVDYLKNLKKEGKIELILNNINYGFTYAINQGIEIADDDSDILLLNNDAELTEGALEHMQSYAYSKEKCGLAVPHEILYKGNKGIRVNVPYAFNDFECDTTPSNTHKNIINIPTFHDGEDLELNFAPFFCTYIKREVYEKTLGLDAELGRHYRSDRIFSNYVRHILNLKIYQCPDSYVYHKHQTATKQLKNNKEEYKYIFRKNQWEPELAEKLNYKIPLWDI